MQNTVTTTSIQKQLNADPEGFYVALHRGSRKALLAGPYDTEEEAAAAKGAAHERACVADPFSWFDVVSLARGEAGRKTVFGRV